MGSTTPTHVSAASIFTTDFKYQLFQYLFSTTVVLLMLSAACQYSWSRLLDTPLKEQIESRAGFVLWLLLHWCAILFVNTLYYPNSIYGVGLAGYYVLLTLSLILLAGYLLVLCHQLLARPRRFLVLVPALALSLIGLDYSRQPVTDTQAELSQPNIIIIGVDSLQSKLINNQQWGEAHMPELRSYLDDSHNLTNAYTTLARTMVAWTSILTGQTPPQHGIRVNLQDFADLEPGYDQFLNYIKSLGYQTTYAIDERRFSNIGVDFGFDQELGPKNGFADFIIGTLGENPLESVVQLTPFGKYLFPYTHVNRAVYGTYRPERYNSLLNDFIVARDRSKPQFLAMHFTLPHHPFSWADSEHNGNDRKIYRLYPDDKVERVFPYYVKTLERTDEQLAVFMDDLKQGGMLDNAIVYFISDHGEGFPRMDEGESFEYGHGTYSGDLTQYKVLMAYSVFKNGVSVTSRTDDDRVASVIDIAPTLVEQLGGETTDFEFSGLSLLGDNIAPDRVVFTESGFTLMSVQVDTPDQLEVLKEGLSAYWPLPNGKVVFDPALIPNLIASKSRSAITRDRVLTVTKTGEAYIDLYNNLPDSEDQAAYEFLVPALCREYQAEIGASARCHKVLTDAK
ncbi:hypothetical protein SIN8267_03323 [Sinobacterium norvegicum]|uniref:Sulfatase N-terminal domain-containing protein n=2 Tax=Sinobacterium norvegicum TaxID=1641715 RepID=A0ABM9AK90_9GAMM|nr:hypothetical protein SIN8267_03323 [Sinobacterium norvegicum]